jgi:hypothetical protein
MSEKAKPAHKISHRGLAITIWKNDGKNGPWYSVTPSRVYKQDEQWKDRDSFGEDDLLLLAELVNVDHPVAVLGLFGAGDLIGFRLIGLLAIEIGSTVVHGKGGTWSILLRREDIADLAPELRIVGRPIFRTNISFL